MTNRKTILILAALLDIAMITAIVVLSILVFAK